MKIFARFYPIFALALFSFLSSACSDSSPTKQTQDQTEASDRGELHNDDKSEKVKTIVFFGNSLTAAYGLEEQEGYTHLIQERIDSLGLPYQVVNAGLSGETTSGGKNRIDWVLKQKVDVFVLELGGNDVLRGLELDATKENLAAIIESVQTKYPDAEIILAGMQAPPNLGEDYVNTFKNIYPDLAKEYDIHLIPFFLQDVGGIPELNQEDRIHPNAKGQYILRENVWKVLGPILMDES